MTVGRDYMLKEQSGPSAPKLFLDTKVVPLAANVAGRVEVRLDRAATTVGVRPSAIVAGVAGGLMLSLVALLRSRHVIAERTSTLPT